MFQVYLVKTTKTMLGIRIRGLFDPWIRESFLPWIRDGKNSDAESGINIPDPNTGGRYI
jgi:hypothetical protein